MLDACLTVDGIISKDRSSDSRIRGQPQERGYKRGTFRSVILITLIKFNGYDTI